MDVLRGHLKQTIRARTPHGVEITIAVTDLTTATIEFRLALGAWITPTTYMLDTSDDAEEVTDAVERALTDLAEDRARFPVV